MFQHDHRIGVCDSGFEETLEVRSATGIGDFDSSDCSEDTLYAGAVVRASRAICAYWNADDTVNGPLAIAQEIAAGQFGKQLIQAGPQVIRKLNFDDGLQSDCTHARCTSDDESLLYRGVEDTMVTKLLCQGGCFPKNAAQAPSHILTVKQRQWVMGQNLLHGMQCLVHHDLSRRVISFPLTGFLENCRGRHGRVHEDFGVGVRCHLSGRKGRCNFSPCRLLDVVQFLA